MKESVQKTVTKRIEEEGRGAFFFGQDFADVGTPEAVKKVLQRLEKAGMLLRIAPGIYYYPKIDEEYGLGVLYPSLSEIAEAIAKRDRATIVPTGAYALNMLGLSTQVPTNAVFCSSGSTRCVSIGEGRGIQFVHTSSVKKLAFQSRLMMLIVSALREIGEDQITDEQLAIIKEHLSHVSQEDYNHDIQLAPAWVRQILHKL